MKERGYRKIKKSKRNRLIIFIIIIIVFIDQLIKTLILHNIYDSSIVIFNGILNLTYVENTGGAYGIGNNNIIMFIIVNIVVITLLTKFLVTKKDEIGIVILISITLVVAGGIANFLDRIFRGHVIDYIDINPLINYPVFNIADICIAIGCIIVFINLVINTIKERKKIAKTGDINE